MDLPPELREALLAVDGGAIPIMEEPQDRPDGEKEAAIVCKVPFTRDQWRMPGLQIGVVHTAYVYVPEGPVFRIVLAIYDNPDNPFKLEAFLNPNEEQDRAIFASWAHQTRFVLHGYDANLVYLGSKILPWKEQSHAAIQRALERTERIPNLWPDVKERCMEENP
jgi:hypothetical protein